MPKQTNDNPKIESIWKPPGKTAGRVKSIFLFIAVVCLTGVFTTFIRHQYDALVVVERKIADVSKEIAKQQGVTENLLLEKARQGSGEYFEKIAREVLGLVYKDEIIFRKRQ